MRKIFLFFLIVISSLANGNGVDIKDISSEIKNIEKEATLKKENIFFQPFIVSVFKGKDLKKLGISNLKEALELIPGVDISSDNIDNKTAVFRGSNPFAYGQSKLIVDGIVVNSVMMDSYSFFMDMPIDIIKRIEVIRGPGGKLDGINAYAGSIYVVTYAEKYKLDTDKDEVFLKVGSFNYQMAGFKKRYEQKGLKIFTDFYYQKHDKKIHGGLDSLNTGLYGDINRPLTREGDAYLWLRNYSLGITLDYKKFKLKARINYYKKGAGYGINYMYPLKDDYVKTPLSFVEGLYRDAFFNLKSTIKLGIKWDDFEINSRAAYPGLINRKLSDPSQLITYKNGFYIFDKTRQITLYQSSFFYYDKYQFHNIKFGYILKKEKTYEEITKNTDRDNENNTQMVDYSQTYPFFDKNAKRYSYILSIEDKYDYSNSLSFNYGVNIENNTHIDLQINPRATAVYKIDSSNILKFMYSRSHRNPSWQEIYTKNNKARVGNSSLKPEIVNAFEIAYTKRFSIDNYFQINIFYLKNRDQINKINSENQYRNAQNTDIYGFEAEYLGMIDNKTKFYANYSFVEGEDDKGNALANVARHMAKAYLIRQITSRLDFNIIGKYVGKKNRIYFDYRDKVDAYCSCDIGLNYEDKKEGYTLNFAIKNIFDSDIRYPSEPYTYDDDYKLEKRSFLISFSKEF